MIRLTNEFRGEEIVSASDKMVNSLTIGGVTSYLLSSLKGFSLTGMFIVVDYIREKDFDELKYFLMNAVNEVEEGGRINIKFTRYDEDFGADGRRYAFSLEFTLFNKEGDEINSDTFRWAGNIGEEVPDFYFDVIKTTDATGSSE